MKRCENCKITFSDSVNFCTECGKALVYVPDSFQFDTGDKLHKPKKRNKRSIWKVILITLVVMIIGFVALLNHVMNAATYLRVEPNILVADKNGGETVVDIDYDGYVWEINHIPDWIEVNEYEQSFSVKAEANLTGHNREGSITVQSGDFIAQVVIQQKGEATYIKASKTAIHFNVNGGRETINIDTDGCNYIVEYPDFLSVSTYGDKIKIKADINTDEYRTGYVTLKEDNVKTRIYITQGGTCSNCHGTGYISCIQCMGQGGWGYGMYYSQCWFCGGSGRIRCGTCDGTGNVD